MIEKTTTYSRSANQNPGEPHPSKAPFSEGSGFTPGPWKVDGSKNDWTAEPDDFDGGSASWQPISAEGRDDPICLVVQQAPWRQLDDKELDANSALIAAAPDLHEVAASFPGFAASPSDLNAWNKRRIAALSLSGAPHV